MRLYYLKLFCMLILFSGQWAAFAQPGSLDTTFGTGGKTDFYLGLTNQYVFGMKVLPDNKMLVYGQEYVSPNGRPKAFLARLTQEGKVDSTFGVNGLAPIYYEYPLWTDQFAIAVQPDGKIIFIYNMSNLDLHYTAVVTRYTADGAFDDTFGVDGIVFLPDDLSFLPYSVVVAPDGKILIGGGASTAWYVPRNCTIYRLNPDGSLDNTFGNDGRSILQVGTYTEHIVAMEMQPDGKIVGVGRTQSQTNIGGIVVMRITDEGNMDPSFGFNGHIIKNYGYTVLQVKKINILPDGKILLAGDIGKNGKNDYCLYKFDSAGMVDTDFGTNGIKVIDLGSDTESVTGVCFQPDGKTILSSYNLSVLKMVEDGSLDNGFGDDGTFFKSDLPVEFDSLGSCEDIGLLSDNKIVLLVHNLAGYAANGQNIRQSTIIRLNNEILSDSKDLPKPTAAAEIFPNPASGVFTLKYTIDKSGPVTIKLTDASGKSVKTLLSNAHRTAGVYEEQYRFAPASAPGLFSVVIESKDGVQVKGVVKN